FVRLGDEPAQLPEGLGICVEMEPVNRNAVRKLVDVAVRCPRMPRPLALPALEARRRDLDPARHEVHPNLDAGDVAVEDRRDQRPARRAGVEAALEAEQSIAPAGERVPDNAAEAALELPALERLPSQLT